uniref:Uncharacterized protein n=1 Tax=viral metagenome TaxID=1070528 RepID=A0A6C0HRJ6_9ZZZZ
MNQDFYKLVFPDWIDVEDLPPSFIMDLSHNPHFIAADILYANFETLDANFASWFLLNEKTLFLYDKLIVKYPHEVKTNHHTQMKYFHLRKENSVDNYRRRAALICETQPMCEITFPEADLAWYYLAANPNKCVIEFLKKNRENINWAVLSENSSDAAAEFLLEERENINWWNASSNTNEKITALFTEQRLLLSGYRLSRNPSDAAVQLLLTDSFTISWISFFKNPNDIAVDKIIEIVSESSNDPRIVWSALCENKNPRILPLLSKNKGKIVWSKFLKNPLCFSYNYKMMRERFSGIKKEIEEMFLRPENVMAMIERERLDSEEDFKVISRLNS